MACQWVLKGVVCCTDSLDDSSNEKEFRQYEKWTAEEEHIFFLKLSTVTSLSLLDGFSAIAHHLPEKNRDQVNMSANSVNAGCIALQGWAETSFLTERLLRPHCHAHTAGQVVLLQAEGTVPEAQPKQGCGGLVSEGAVSGHEFHVVRSKLHCLLCVCISTLIPLLAAMSYLVSV